MKTLLNFAHPLGDEARKQIEAQEGPFQEIIIQVQLDLDCPLSPQVADIEASEHDVRLQDADLVVPPSLSAAAYLLAAQHLAAGDRPKVVWLKRAEGMPPRFVLGGIE